MMPAAARFAVAPMIDWTDRHCRMLHRQLTRHALLFTEMIVAEAVIRGDRDKLLGFDPVEQPVALQLGGSEPARLAEAACIGEGFGYREVNLNVGCPSDRVQSGTFGACLMRTPALVADCVAAMKARVGLPVTVKCRLGVDEQDPEAALDTLADAVLAAGADGIWVHARKAWLKGLSPKENREIPPLDHDRVIRLKRRLPDAFIGINGGVVSLDHAERLLAAVDGVMLGRAAYQEPALLASVDRRIFGVPGADPEPLAVAEAMIAYAARQAEAGVRVGRIARHMLGLFHGQPGARLWRRLLTIGSARTDAGPELIAEALAAVRQAQAEPASAAA